MKPLKFLLVFLCALLAFAVQAQALLITPSSSADFFGNETSQAQINTIIGPIISPAVELYKQDFDLPEANLPLQNSYQTTFSNSDTAPSNALIKYTGGNIVGPIAWLLVKDGNQTPAWYLFNLTAAPDPQNWNGTDDLVLEDFWPEQGSISHVALYGTPVEGQPIPEPVSMLLFGTGLVGIGGYIRRRFKK